MDKKFILDFTPTGMIPTKDMTPHVPVQPAEIVEQVLESAELGANMAHIHARGNGRLQEKKDFQEVFDAVTGLGHNHHLIHLTGVTYNEEGEQFHVPIRKGDMPVLKLMECIIENEYDVTIISESPILEHDAVYAQILLDRAMEITK